MGICSLCKDLKSISRKSGYLTLPKSFCGVTIVTLVLGKCHCSVTYFFPSCLSGKLLLCQYLEVYVRLFITALHSVNWNLIIDESSLLIRTRKDCPLVWELIYKCCCQTLFCTQVTVSLDLKSEGMGCAWDPL